MNYIILGGSAAFDQYDLLEKTLDAYRKELEEKFTVILADQKSDTHDQKVGIAALGAQYCRKNNLPVLTFITSGKSFSAAQNKSAIILRNTKIAKFIAEEFKKEKFALAAFIFMHDDHELDTDGRSLAAALSTRGFFECLHFIPIKLLAPDSYTGPHHIETKREDANGVEGGSAADRDKKAAQQ